MTFRGFTGFIACTLTILVANSASALSPQLSKKFISANLSNAIDKQYIVVLEDNAVSLTINQKGLQRSFTSEKEIRSQAISSMAISMEGRYGVSVSRQYSSAISGFTTQMNSEQLESMLADERVKFIEQDQVMTLNDVQRNATWGLDRLDQAGLPLDRTYEYFSTGRGVDAYIIDTGIAPNSNYSGRLRSGFSSINDGRGTGDCNGHGSHVAGTTGSDTWGVAKGVNLIPVRVFGCGNSTSNSAIISGVDYVVRNASGPSVVNMSLGGGVTQALDNAVNRGINAGIVFVVAAGNSNANACNSSPARVPRAITVAATNRNDSRASFSNWGSCVDIFAPGEGITSLWSNGGTRTISGTSMASPHVAGVVAQYLQNNRSASTAQVERAVESAAVSGRVSGARGSPNLLLQTFGNGGSPDPDPDPDPDPTPGGCVDFRSTAEYSSASPGSTQVSSDGCTIRLTGNEWRITTSRFNVTASTVITFEFSASGAVGEIQGVGFDADTTASPDRIFQLRGTQDWGIDDFSYTGGTQTFRIPVGQYYTGSMGFVIANDQDAGSTSNVVTVSNVRISN